MFKKVDASMNFTEREKEVEDFWKENRIFERSIEVHEGDPSYVFYDGPPTANGKPHIGHVETRAFKDMIPRFHAMKGRMVPRKAGWDTHGLPVELEVEKQIGINGKEQIENYGVAPFIDHCKENVWKYKGMWEDFSYKVGFWADMDDPYVTYHDDFIESEWWALKEIWNKKLLYKGFKVVPYCPRCGTPLSSHEVAQGYKTLKERSAIVRFKAKDGDFYFLAWTTTPWTLPSNTALCVNPDLEYAKVRSSDGNTYILASNLLDRVLKSKEEDSYEVIETFKGDSLKGMEYEPLYECAGLQAEKQHRKAHYVVCDSYVTSDDGTGIVHIAPAFGEDDARIGRENDLPLIQFVDSKGKMTDDTPFAGMRCKPTEDEMKKGAVSCDPEVLKDLERTGKLFSAPKFEHEYPHCWRCSTPLIYYARESWFIRMTQVKDDLVKNNSTIRWYPETIGTGRFGAWIQNVQDWGISRNRYWGTPLNIWECSECGSQEAVGSVSELKEKAFNYNEVLLSLKKEGRGVNSEYLGYEHIELHKPYVDMLKIKCPCCGKDMTRVPEVIDCWFDSGAMPYAQHHYPFENRELFEKQFPAQFICEAVDQTRGWFYSLLAESTILFNKSPFETCLVLGHVQDEKGQKMSKSLGNAVDPMDALTRHGADAVRWFFYTNSAPWLPKRFHDKAVIEGQRKFLSTFWNTYAFFVLYANIDNFDPGRYTLSYDRLNAMDRWLLSRLMSVVKEVDKDLENFRIPEAAALLQSFTEDMSNWYVRRSRERFWAKGMEEDKINAYETLYTALVTLSKAAAPMVPFITEAVYRNLVCEIDKEAPISVHLSKYPEVIEEWIDPDLEKSMDEALKIVILGRAARNQAQVKNRQPLSAMYVKAEGLTDYFVRIICDELNVKKVEFKTDLSEFASYSFKPQLKTLGKRFGKNIGLVKEILSSDGSSLYRELREKGFIEIDLDGINHELKEEDLLIEVSEKDGFVTEEESGVTVVLDTNLTEDLIEEGIEREIISKIQTMRKEAGFEVMDKISVGIITDDETFSIADKLSEDIKRIVMADELNRGANDGYSKEWDINGRQVELFVKKK